MRVIIIIIILAFFLSSGGSPSRTNWDLQAPYSWAEVDVSDNSLTDPSTMPLEGRE